MAIIKVAKGGKTIGQAINYASKDKLTVGKDISSNQDEAKEQMKITKELNNKTEGRQYKHYIQSFATGEVDVNKAQEIGLKWAEMNFKGYEVFIGTHTDKDHIHNHFVVNSVNFENGKKFNVDKNFLNELKNNNDLICKEHGLEIVQKTAEKGDVRAYNQEKYQTLLKASKNEVKSYLVDLSVSIKLATAKSTDIEEFKKNMIEQGYTTKWQDNIKNVTFENENGKKIRLSNLEKTFNDTIFTKEGLTNEFTRVSEKNREIGRIEQNSNRAREQGSNSTREIIGDEQSFKNGNGEQSTQGAFDRVLRDVRGIEQDAKQYSPKTRDRNAIDEEQNKQLRKQQLNTKSKPIKRNKGLER